jgi:spore coat polysaccharide biosynthesis protein SpsF (cytidylyltransferase family)
MRRCIAFIQARMSSSRFPGKVLEPIAGTPSIVYMVRRARRSRTVDEVVVVTSTDPSDDALVETLKTSGVPFFRGDLHDVLCRFADAAHAFDAREVVRLTGDCPLIDPEVVDAVVQLRRERGADYSSNIDPPTYPDGLDCECFTREALEAADRLASAGPEREHVTLWMRAPGTSLRRVNHRCIVDASHLRLTVDYPDDLKAVRSLVDEMGSDGRFGLFDLLRALDRRRDILALNPHARNEALAR